MDLHLKVLGPLEVVRGGEHVSPDRPAQRRLLSILALESERRISTDRLIERFWPDEPPETARAAIQTHVSATRKALGDGVVVTEGYGYRLNLDNIGLDVPGFYSLAEDAIQHSTSREWSMALKATEAALALWRGDPFAELADDEFARAEITRLRETELELLENRAEALIALNRVEEALPDLESLVVENPYRERLWEHLMTARYRLGRNAEALRAYQEVSGHLAEMGVEPGAPLRRLEEKILLHDRALTQTKHNLPSELDSFIGRENEVEEITHLLSNSRLVTLTGAGGSGKTRLATHTARQLLDNYPDGIWLVELASIDDPSLIPSEVAQVIGVKPRTEDITHSITSALANDQALIVLDNCEHLLDESARTTRRLLESCSELKIMATSRQPLRVPGEKTYTVPGLASPSEQFSLSDALDHDAVRLFVERSRSSGSFTLSERNVGPVAEICRRLDGIPLAIELAAARTASLTPEAISSRLDERFRLLRGGSSTASPKHQSLEAAIDWSYQLLTRQEQTVLNRLGVFRGGFDLEMAERVTGGHGLDRQEIAPIVDSLVSKSLVTRYDLRLGRRYRLLETIREYANLRLAETGETARARHEHALWAGEFCDRFWDHLSEGGHDDRIMRLHVEFDNLTGAIEWVRETADRTLWSKLLSTIAWHWWDLRYLARAYETMARSRELCDDRIRRAELSIHLSHLAWTVNRSDEAWTLSLDAYETLRDLPPSSASVLAATRYASFHWVLVDRNAKDGLAISEEAVRQAESLSNVYVEIRARDNHSIMLVSSGREQEGLEELDRMLDLLTETKDSDFALGHYHSAITTLMTVRSARRTRPREIVDMMLAIADSDEQLTRMTADWTAFVYMQTGEFDAAARILDQDAQSEHLEAMDQLSLLIPRAFLLWMQGNLEDAWADVRACEAMGVNPRWYHDFLAVKAEIATDRGLFEVTRETAEFYLAFDVAASEAVKKLGTLHPLVRAEVEGALGGDSDESSEHETQARDALATMHQIRTEYPPPSTGSYMAETHGTHLTFATAEVSRLEGSDPGLWRKALEEADFIYYRLYAQIRLGEALLLSGASEDAQEQLREARDEALRIGAARLATLANQLLSD